MKGGIRLAGKKEWSVLQWTIGRLKLPPKVHIPLACYPAAEAEPCVNIGDTVLTGQKIAEVPSSQFAIPASLSGKIISIASYPHPLLGETKTIEIESDEKDQSISQLGQERAGWENLSSEELLALFQENGLLDLKQEVIPIALKISLKQPSQKWETLLINGCESEPYVSSNYTLTMSHSVEILKGAEILRRAAKAEKIVIAFTDQQMEAAELLKSKIYFLKWEHIDVRVVTSKFPQENDQMLEREIKKENLKESLGRKNSEVLTFNIATAFAVYEAIVLQKPFYERAVTIAGECLFESKNLWVRVGTSFGTAIKGCKGLLREPRKLLMGGPMKGIAQLSLDVPVIAGTQAILALPKEVSKPEDVQPCIRCGKCIEACPVEISPAMITMAVEGERTDIARQLGVDFCIECGNCAYVCPSKRPMVELIRYALS